MGVKWGVLGTAGIAKSSTIPGMKQAKDVELYAVAGRDEAKAKKFKEDFGFEKYYVGYESLLNDPQVQAVYIPLPNHLHYEWTIKALEAGKHVLCEKPLALNAEQVKKMFEVAKQNGVFLMEAYAYLHNEYTASLVEDIKSGLIGNIDYIDTAFLTQNYSENVRLYKEQGGGAVYDVGCYCTTMILTILNAFTDKGYATKFLKVMADAEFNDKGSDELAQAMIRFENGIRSTFNVGMNLGVDSDDRYDRLFIHGDKGYIRSDVEYNQAGNVTYRVVSGDKEITRGIQVSNNYKLESEQLTRAILGKEQPYITEEFSLANANLLGEVLKKIGYL